MQGRLENDLKIKARTEKILKNMPKIVVDYYYTLQVSKEASTCYSYIVSLKQFWEFLQENGVKDFRNVDEIIIGKYFAEIAYTNRTGETKQTSFSHRKTMWTILNNFFTYLLKKKIIEENPLTFTERPQNVDVLERKFLTVEDLNKILQAVDEEGGDNLRKKSARELNVVRDKLIISLLMVTGMRRTALTQINVDDFSIQDNRLVVTDKRNKTQIYYLTPEIEKLMKEWLQIRKNYVYHDNVKTDALFINNSSTRISSQTVYKLVKKYSKEGLGYEISPHKLRAAFTSLYYEASGGDIEATRKAVGHANISTTSIYITQRNDARKEAIEFMTSELNI